MREEVDVPSLQEKIVCSKSTMGPYLKTVLWIMMCCAFQPMTVEEQGLTIASPVVARA